MNNPHLKMWVSSSETTGGAFIPRLKTGVPVGSFTPEGADDLKSHRSEAVILLFPADESPTYESVDFISPGVRAQE